MRSKIYASFIIVICVCVLTVSRLSAQNYILTTSSGNPLVPGTTLVAGSQGDDQTALIALPFTYNVYGVAYTTVRACTNGNLQFTTNNATFTNVCPLPAAALGAAFHPHWDDLHTGRTASEGIFTSISGVAPNRVFNIEWRAELFSGTGQNVSFEARLFEGLQRVDFIYAAVSGGGSSASVGVQTTTGALQTTFECNTGGIVSGLGLSFEIPPPYQFCAQNFDGVSAPALPTGWTATTLTAYAGSTPWATTNAVSNSAPNSASTNDPDNISDEVLDSRVFPIISATSQLSFRNSYNLESTFDGMVLEISIGGGPFTDIITAGGSFVGGGYNGTISTLFSSPIGGRSAWTGNSGGFITTTVNLPAAANGQNVVLRWRRASDQSVSGVGVWIDDITLTWSNCMPECVVTCPSNIIVSNAPNQCGQIVNYPAPTSNGACGPLSSSPASGSFFPVGVNTVTVTSFSGPRCTFTIRVNDVQSPVITCPSNITTGNTPGFCGAIVNFSVTASDNCPGVTVASSPASGSLFPVGTTTVTSTATDASGNTATCTFTVTVNDTEPPSFTSAALFPERLYYKFDGSGATVPNLATAPPAGTLNATLTGLTQGGSGKCGGALIGTGASGLTNFMNTNWVPNMTAPWTISFWLGPNQIDNNPSYLFGALSAGSFRCFYGGAALTNNVLLRGGTGDILITGVNPTATLITVVYNGSNTVVYKNGASPQTYGVTFSNIGSTPLYVGAYNSGSALASMNGTMDEFSMYTRALTAAEVLSLYNACPVYVNTCPSNITVNNDPGQCSAVVTYTTPVGRDNCPGVTTVRTLGLASGSVFPLGTTTCRYVATDLAGNTATCQFNVTVVDAQPPSITCPANITRNTDVGLCYATVATPNPTFGDNCGVTKLTWTITGATSASSPATGINYVGTRQFNLNGTTGQGVSTVTYTATDGSGNSTSCSYTVTVNDGWLPVISIQPATQFVCSGSNALFNVAATANGGPIAYQWQEWNGSAWANITGATTNSYTLPTVSIADNTRTFRVVLTGTCSVVNSIFATLYINPLPTVSLTTSIPPYLLPGQSMDITASASPAGGNYAWYLGSSVIQNGPSNVYSGVTVDDQGTYKVIYTDLNGCVATSANLVVTGQASDKLWVYPNPNTGEFQVRIYNQLNEPITVRVFDSKGAKVYERTANTNTPYTSIPIKLDKLTIGSGIYTVTVTNSQGKQMGSKNILVHHNL